MSLAFMSDSRYNTGANHIKSGQMLEASTHPFSTDVKGIDTMTHSIPNQSALKVCSKCGQSKPLTEYSQYKKGNRAGQYRSSCRACAVVATMASRAKRPNYSEEQREYQRAWRERHQARLTLKDSQRYASDPERRKESARRARERNPLREKAHYVVRRAVKRGDFPPAWSMVCDVCQEAQAQHWHHYLGYAEEHHLHVISVCKPCHGKEHEVS